MAATKVARTNPSVRVSTSGQASGSTAVSVLNAGAVNGDLLLAFQSLNGSGDPYSMRPPDNYWQQRGPTVGSSTYGYMIVWWKRANNEPANWSFAKTGNGCVAVLSIKNWDDSSDAFFDGEPQFSNGGPSTTHSTPNVHLRTSLTLQIRAFSGNSGGGTHFGYTPGSWTENQDVAVSGSNFLAVASQASGGAGDPGTVNATSSVSTGYVGVSLSIAAPPDSAADNYVPSVTVPHWSTDGNTLIALIGANSAGADSADSCQVSSVIDDAHNVWVQGSSRFQTATDSAAAVRTDIWYCAGARPVTKVTATMTETVDGLGVEVMEFTGLTNVNPIDFATNGGNASTTSQAATGTTTNAADVVVAIGANGDSSKNLTQTLGSYTAGVGASATGGLSSTDNVQFDSAYRITSSTGAQSTTFNNASATVLGWAMLALKQGSLVTTNPNPYWPQMVHEVGFGYDPNDPSVDVVYTPITTKVEEFAFQRGRSYELARVEAGEGDVHVSNHDGRFDPTNLASPYAPNVKVLTPYRCRATWNGQSYNIFTGYVERWPQKWDDQRGLSRMLVVDGLATLAGTQLAGALGEEITADNPWAYWPLDDGRLADSGANKATQSSTALSIQNSAFGGGTAGFGYTMALQSEDSTCWQQDRSSSVGGDSAPTSPTAIYGKCLGAVMTLPQLSDGILMECWAKVASTSAIFNYTLMALKADTHTNQAQRQVMVVQMDSNTGLVQLYVSFDSGGLTSLSTGLSGLNDNTFHHYVVHMTTTTLKMWVDGNLRVNAIVSSPPTAPVNRFEVGGEIDPFCTQSIASGAQFAHIAIFKVAVADERRIAARANAGLTGFPEKTGARIRRILNYGGWTGPAAVDTGLTFLGATSTIPRQTLLAAAQDVTSWENGLGFVDGSGNFRFVDRQNRFDQNIKYVFGGNTGEIPYDTDVEIDFDPKYVFNDVTVTRVLGRTPGTGANITTNTGSSSSHKTNDPSIKSYFTRTLQKTTGAASIAQCELEAQWILDNYASPRARLTRIVINPSANPALWPVVLGIEIGDRVLVRRQPFGGAPIELDCYVEQVGHQTKPGDWKTVLALSPVLLSTYSGSGDWILDASTLNVDTTVGSP